MLKINNILIENFDLNDENVIYAKDFKEEFFGIYNIKFSNQSILCESKIPNHISCEINYNGEIFENVSFEIKKSNEEKILINENLLCEKIDNTKFIPSEKIINVQELINEEIKREDELLGFKKKIEKEKNILIESFNSLKKEYDVLKKNKFIMKKEIKILEEEMKKIKKGEDFNIIESEIRKIKKSIIDELKSELLNEKNNSLLLEENNYNSLINEDINKINKKVENFENQISSLNKDKTKTQNLIQTVKSYTDAKIAQALEESKRFTRTMMDMVGGGSGSVAVQLAKGGVVDGNLVVTKKLEADVDVRTLTLSSLDITGDLDVGGTMSATTILSGGRNITDIFAGEGTGDDNPLDGGLM